MDRPFGRGEIFQFILERVNHGGGGEQAAMVRERGVPNQHFLVLECGNFVADDLGGFQRHNGADGSANLGDRAAGGFRDSGKVCVNG